MLASFALLKGAKSDSKAKNSSLWLLKVLFRPSLRSPDCVDSILCIHANFEAVSEVQSVLFQKRPSVHLFITFGEILLIWVEFLALLFSWPVYCFRQISTQTCLKDWWFLFPCWLALQLYSTCLSALHWQQSTFSLLLVGQRSDHLIMFSAGQPLPFQIPKTRSARPTFPQAFPWLPSAGLFSSQVCL